LARSSGLSGACFGKILIKLDFELYVLVWIERRKMGKVVDLFSVFGRAFLSGAFSVWKVLFYGGIDSCKTSVLSPPPNALCDISREVRG